MTTKKINELPVSTLTEQDAMSAYIPISGIEADGDDLQRVDLETFKRIIHETRTVVPHTYWRIYFDANNSTSSCGVSELQFFEAGSGTNAVTEYANVVVASGGTGSLAFDGNPSTSWTVAGTSGVWIGYRFSQAVGIARVRITAATITDQSPKDFRVQYSDNGTTWTDAWTVTGQTGWIAGESRHFTNPSPTWVTVPTYGDENAVDAVAAALGSGGAGVTVTYNDGANTITVAADPEFVRDTIATALVAGAGVTITPNDGADTITISSSVTQYTDEMARDAIGSALVAGSGVTITVNDGADTITISSTGGGGGGSLPAGGTTGQVLAKASNTDGDATWIDAPTGGSASTGGDYLPNYAPPLPTDFPVTVAAAGSTITLANSTSGMGFKITSASASGVHNTFAGRAAASPFSMVGRVQFLGKYGNPFQVGFSFYNSGNGRFVSIGKGRVGSANPVIEVNRWASTTAFASNQSSYGGTSEISDNPFYKLEHDGTNLTFSISGNGTNWTTVYTETVAAYLGAVTHVGLFSDLESTNEITGYVDWYEDSNLPARRVASGGGTTSGDTKVGPHRYWKISQLIPTSAGASPSMAEFRLRSSLGGANLAVSSVSASDTYSGQPATNLYDGNTATLWGANAGANLPEIVFDMGSAVDVAEVVVTSRNDATYYNQTPRSFDLYFSDDNINFTLVSNINIGVFTGALQQKTAAVPTIYPYKGATVPSFTSNAGKFLAVNGTATDVEWVSMGGGGWKATATGTGATQNISIPSGLAANNVLVFVNGIRYSTTEFTISGTTLTLTTNASGDAIEIIYAGGSGGATLPSLQAHKYWRIFVWSNNGSSAVAIGEVEMRATPGGADQCVGGTASASSELSGSFPASNAFNDNGGTSFWVASTGTGEWLAYQFATPVVVQQIALTSRSDGYTTDAPKAFCVQWSDDGDKWQFGWGPIFSSGWTAGASRTFTTPDIGYTGGASSGGISAAPFRGAMVYKTTGLTGLNLTGTYVVPWDSETYDTDEFHSTVTNTERFTIPSGVSKIRLHAVIHTNNALASDYLLAAFRKNGLTDVVGLGRTLVDSSNVNQSATLVSGIIPVVAGDYFDLALTSETDTSIDLNGLRCSFSIEVIENTLGVLDTRVINNLTNDYTLQLADASSYIRMNKATSANITVPTNASVAFPVGTEIPVTQKGAGQVTFVAASGVTINTSETLKLRRQNSTALLIKVASDEWDLTGDVQPSTSITPFVVYYNKDDTQVSTGTTPTSPTSVISVTIPASATARTFMINGNIVWGSGGHGMRGSILRDTTQIWPPLGGTDGIDPVNSGDGYDHLPFSGVLVSVPGDNASHTISLAWSSQSATSSLTLYNRHITAIQVG